MVEGAVLFSAKAFGGLRRLSPASHPESTALLLLPNADSLYETTVFGRSLSFRNSAAVVGLHTCPPYYAPFASAATAGSLAPSRPPGAYSATHGHHPLEAGS